MGKQPGKKTQLKRSELFSLAIIICGCPHTFNIKLHQHTGSPSIDLPKVHTLHSYWLLFVVLGKLGKLVYKPSAKPLQVELIFSSLHFLQGSRGPGKVHSFGKRDHSIKRNLNIPVVVRGWLYKQVSLGLSALNVPWILSIQFVKCVLNTSVLAEVREKLRNNRCSYTTETDAPCAVQTLSD